MIKYKTIESKTILNIPKFIDDWFISKGGMNLYRGCEHACEYCDGRAEKYQTQEDFGKTVYVKINAPKLFSKEIKKIKEKTIICLGGGVGDSYQKCEERFKLTRQILKIIKNQEYLTLDMQKKSNISCEILTKSTLVERDIEMIFKINNQSRAIVMFSISSMNDDICKIFEPRASLPKERLNTLKKFSKLGIPTGVMFVPMLPYLSDDEDSIKEVVKDVKNAGANFILFGGMTLKEGRQKEHFMRVLQKNYPKLVDKYTQLYKNSGKYGNANSKYYKGINQLAYKICKDNKIETRIPYEIFKDKIEMKYEVSVLLAHIAHYLRMEGEKYYNFRKASFDIQKISEPIERMVNEKIVGKISSVGKFIEDLVEEIVVEGKCGYYDEVRNY